MSLVVGILLGFLLALGIGAGLFALVSLVDGVRFSRRVAGSLHRPDAYEPPTAILVPARGSDPKLDRTLEALDGQEYADYRLVFITDPGDPVEQRLRETNFRRPTTFLQAGAHTGCSGKIAALLTGLESLDEGDAVIVFADSDAVPDRRWLRSLVAPLRDPEVAASTGYRWYFPLRGGLGPALQSAWNSAAASVLFSPRWRYLWGGSYAVRRALLEEVDIAQRWERTLSDDMVMTKALQERDLGIAFTPRATVANYTGGTWRDVVRWTNRQACLALLYNPAMRRLTLPYGLYVGSFVLALLAIALSPLDPTFLVPATLLLSPVYLGLVKGALRRSAFARSMPAFRDAFRRHRLWFYLGTLVLPFLMLYNVRKAKGMSAFTWRGKVYRFTSPEHIVVETEP